MLDIDAFVKSLTIMGKGMLGIFIVTGIIILVTICLNKFTEEKDEM